MLEWTEEKPQNEGRYLFKSWKEWRVCVVEVHYGKWQSAQNPDWLYATTDPIDSMKGQWYGPIPEPLK